MSLTVVKLVPCVRCNVTGRDIDTVLGLCRRCAADELEQLRAEVERLRMLDAIRVTAARTILNRLKGRKETDGEGQLSLSDKIDLMTIAGRWQVRDEPEEVSTQ